MKTLIDLNADAGESFGRWKLGDDAALLPQVSSVNVACGWHAGDPATMRRSVELAAANGVALGAHPGFPDLAGFGRRAMALSPSDAADTCLYQYGALRGFADEAGARIAHVKPHGALYGLTLRDPDVATAIAASITKADPTLLLVLLAGPTAERVLADGFPVAREAFADLDYDDNGHIIIEPVPEAKDPEACAQQAIDVLNGRVTSVNGTTIEVDADTICLHGDRPNSVEIARAVRARFAQHGVSTAAMHEVVAARGR
ncbi:putative lactam utilization protein B-like protein [Prauserella sp. Am3]|nr:putative lactam utilization protein B-like protein [Prauserella sp. Am3]